MKARADIRRVGFTLIELLIVIALIALLITLLLPSLNLALHNARGIQCLGNLRAISTAARLYAQDANGKVPRGNRPYWFLEFLPHLPQDSDKRDFRNNSYFKCPNYPKNEEVVHYVVSDFGFCGADDVTGYSLDEATPLKSIDYPSNTIYFADHESGHWRPILTGYGDNMIAYHDVWKVSHLANSNTETLSSGRRVANSRHQDGCNALYFDGHAGWVKASTMTVDMWRDYWGTLGGRRFNKR